MSYMIYNRIRKVRKEGITNGNEWKANEVQKSAIC